MLISDYSEGPGGPFALVTELAQELRDAQSAIVHEGPGFAVLRTGAVLDWTDTLDRPARVKGTTCLDKPADFAGYLTRHQTAESVVYADKRSARLTVVFNGHDAMEPGLSSTQGLAGFGDHRAVVNLVEDEDWTAWVEGSKRMHPQATFGELIEGLAHTMVTPDGATMLEIALSLTARSKIDYSSRARLDNGDMSFKFEQDTDVRAGKRGSEVEVPTQFTFRATPWEGVEPVEVTARLRVKPGPDGVLMGYRIMRLGEAVDTAFDSVIAAVEANIPEHVEIFRGAAPGDRRTY